MVNVTADTNIIVSGLNFLGGKPFQFLQLAQSALSSRAPRNLANGAIISCNAVPAGPLTRGRCCCSILEYTILKESVFQDRLKLAHSKKWSYAVLLAEVLVFYRHVIFRPGQYVIPWDFRYYHFNQISFLAASLGAGHFPLWDPYTYCGRPFYTNLQSQVFYPPTLLTAFASNIFGGNHLLLLLTLHLVLHVFLAGVYTFWLLTALGCGRLAALAGATAFQLGCYFASQTQHLGAVDGAVWLPLSALAVVVLARGPSARWVAVLAFSLAMPILAGFSSSIAATFICSFVLVLALIASRTATWRLLLHYGVGAGASLALAAIQLLPTLQNAKMSVSRYRGDWRSQGSGIRLEALPSLIWPNWFHILDLHGYNLPYNFTFLYLYCGIGTLVLAGLAFAPKGSDMQPEGLRHRYTISFLILTITSALMMHGDATLPGSLLLPYFLNAVHDSVYPEFMMAGFSLGVAVLAGLGAERFAAKPAVSIGILLLVFVDLTYFGSARPMNTMSTKQEPGITPKHFDGSVPLLATVRSFVNTSEPPARLETYSDSMGWTSMAASLQLPTANGDDPLALIRFMSVRRLFCGGTRWGRYYEVTQLDSPILDLLNVRYLVSRNPLPVNSKFRLVAQPPAHYLYENAAALPRFFLVRRTMASGSEEQSLALMRSGQYDPAQAAIVEGGSAQEYPEGSSPAVHVVSYGQNEVVLETNALKARFLVTSEADYPGWRASIDGSDARIVRTNVAFRGLAIPAGHHRIVFRFRPPILSWSAGVSAMTLAAALLALRRPRGRVG